ncbi:hypothetical protein L9F63_024523, partial [Diploptera punctata]
FIQDTKITEQLLTLRAYRMFKEMTTRGKKLGGRGKKKCSLWNAAVFTDKLPEVLFLIFQLHPQIDSISTLPQETKSIITVQRNYRREYRGNE